jgi:hypothetical protein
MKTVYWLYLDTVGEVEGMFSESGEMLGTWCNNDASWRNDYFCGFMEKLGVDVVSIAEHDFPEMTKKLEEYWDNY